MGSKKTEPDFLAELRAAAPSLSRRWEDRLPPEVRQQLDSVLAAHQRGELRLSVNAIRTKFCERFGFKVSKTTFSDYLARTKAGSNG